MGTAINMIGVGYSCELFSSLIAPMIGDNIIVRICLLAAGIIVLCFSCSLFFVSNIGVGPYDSVGFMISNATKIHYKWVRVMTDIAVIIIGLVVSGGFTALMRGDLSGVKNIGIGTIITAFMMGPLVNFFSKHVSSKILDVNYAELSRDVAFFMIKGAMVKNRVPDDYDPARLNINSPEYNVINDGELKEI